LLKRVITLRRQEKMSPPPAAGITVAA
jgi:hypothetical protein